MAELPKNSYWLGKKGISNKEVQYVWARQKCKSETIATKHSSLKAEGSFLMSKASSPQETGSKKESEVKNYPWPIAMIFLNYPPFPSPWIQGLHIHIVISTDVFGGMTETLKKAVI